MIATAASSRGLPTFDDRYVAERAIDRRGFTTRYAGFDRFQRRRVTITVLAPACPADEATASRFYRDVIDVLRLDHPNVVAAFEAVLLGASHEYRVAKGSAFVIEGASTSRAPARRALEAARAGAAAVMVPS